MDALLVTELANVRYLTGFTGPPACWRSPPRRALLTTDGRYRTQSAQQVSASGAPVEIAIGAAAAQREAVRARSAGPRVGLEADSVSWAASRRWTELLEGRELVATTGLVEALREVKDEGEVARMARAAAIADAALAEVLPLLAPASGERPTEEAFALALDTAMRRGGAESTAFETIVAAGENSAKPHHHPTDRPIAPGRPGGGRLRGDLRGLPLGHDPHLLRRRRARPASWPGSSRWCGARRPPAWPRCGPGGGQGGRRRLPAGHRRRRLGRRLRARHRATAWGSTSTRPRR